MDTSPAALLHTPRIARAIRFSIKTHEVYQKQKRKGKDIPYITHPLIVGLILARAGGDEDVVIAGILHDTIEDSPPEKKVTKEMLVDRFGERVAELVDAVTEQDKKASWAERKRAALGHIAHFSHDQVLVKSADIISNTTELMHDYLKHGEETFSRFNEAKEKTLGHTIVAIETLLARWPESPLAPDLRDRQSAIQRMLDGVALSEVS